jgi:hypothetical protein
MKEKTGIIQYYAMKHKGFIRRRIKWTDKCKEWVSNSGVKLLTYFDLDADGYRTASKDWFIKWN